MESQHGGTPKKELLRSDEESRRAYYRAALNFGLVPAESRSKDAPDTHNA